jgi:hypothetical protein
MVAMIGRRTVPESLDRAQKERDRIKRGGGYKKRRITSDQELHRRRMADGVYTWLEEKLGTDFLEEEADHRTLLKSACGGKVRLDVVGMECTGAELPMSEWFAKKGGESRKSHTNISSLRCVFQSKRDPSLVRRR